MCLLVRFRILSIRENGGTTSEESVDQRRLEGELPL